MRTLGLRTVNPFTKFLMWGYGILKNRRSIWNRGICRTYREALELGLIEPRIAPLVAKLNVDGIVSTSACCEGHGEGLELPYIGLSADIRFVAAFNEKLIEASPLRLNRLNHHWIVEYGSWLALRPHVASKFDRHLIDEDFATIGRIVDETVDEFT